METIAEIAKFLEQENETSACPIIDVRLRSDRFEVAQEILNAYVSSLGFRSIDRHWESIPKSQVKEILCGLLHRDLAYSEEIMSLATAQHIAAKFLACFDSDSDRVFSNARFENNRLSSWFSLSKATFDVAIVIYDDHNIGIIYVDAED